MTWLAVMALHCMHGAMCRSTAQFPCLALRSPFISHNSMYTHCVRKVHWLSSGVLLLRH